MLDGDIEANVHLLGGGQTAPHQFIGIAEAMEELGRDDVLAWATRGIAETSGSQIAQRAWADERAGTRAVPAERELGGLVDVLLADREPDAAWQVTVDNAAWDPGKHRWMRMAESRESSVPGDAFEIYLRLADVELEKTGRATYTSASPDVARWSTNLATRASTQSWMDSTG